jgi:hypothetical protein
LIRITYEFAPVYTILPKSIDIQSPNAKLAAEQHHRKYLFISIDLSCFLLGLCSGFKQGNSALFSPSIIWHFKNFLHQ